MNNCELYKTISLEIIKSLESKKVGQLEELMNKRDNILQEEENNKEFKDTMINEGILDIDLKIKELLNENIDKVKKEIREHKLSKQVNNSYVYTSKQKINIFNEKI